MWWNCELALCLCQEADERIVPFRWRGQRISELRMVQVCRYITIEGGELRIEIDVGSSAPSTKWQSCFKQPRIPQPCCSPLPHPLTGCRLLPCFCQSSSCSIGLNTTHALNKTFAQPSFRPLCYIRCAQLPTSISILSSPHSIST